MRSLLVALWAVSCAGFVRPGSSVSRSRTTGTRAAATAAAAEVFVEEELPEPRVNDIVAYAGDWPGESLVGQIRSLQYARSSWLADVVPLEDQAKMLWRAPSAPRARATRRAVLVRDLVPLEAEYVSESDAWRIEREGETADGAPKGLSGSAIGLERRAQSYSALAESFVPKGGSAPRVNYDGEAAALVSYSALKQRLIVDAALAGVVGLAICEVTCGNADAAAFALGAVSSVAYNALLGRAVDAKGSEKQDVVGESRLAPPLLAAVLLAAYHKIFDATPPSTLSFIPKDEFASLVAGLLSYRVPLFVREVFAPTSADEISGLLPGSLGAAAREKRTFELAAAKRKEEGVLEGKEKILSSALSTVLVVCGPAAAGKSTLVRRLLEVDDRFAAPAWTTVANELDSKFAKDDSARKFIIMPTADSDKDGAFVQSRKALRLDELLQRQDKKVAVLDCDVDTARALAGSLSDNAIIIGVWVSLDSLDQLRDRIELAESQRVADDDSVDDKSEAVAKVVKARLAGVIDDIDFGVRSGLFEFTIINSGTIDDSFAKLQRAAKYVFM